MVRTYGANNGSLGGVFAQNKVRIARHLLCQKCLFSLPKVFPFAMKSVPFFALIFNLD